MKKSVYINGVEITARSINVEEYLGYAQSTQGMSGLDAFLLPKITIPLLAMMVDMAKEDLYKFTPSQLEELQDAALEVNPHFFLMMDRITKMSQG
jgi:hypothetical protein